MGLFRKSGLLLIVFCGMMLPAYAANSEGVNLKPKTEQDWQKYLRFRRDETLESLYKVKPEAKFVIERAEGYAVFSNFGMKIIFVGGGSGRGLLHDNKTGKETFMRMAQGGVGWGLGIKDFLAVFVFDDRKVMEDFRNSGWSFGTEANAAAKGADAGIATSGAIAVAPGVRVYQLTENGLMLDVMVNGTKYWVDKSVNGN
jgi:lipid-binding SYLF domain-containing protein